MKLPHNTHKLARPPCMRAPAPRPGGSGVAAGLLAGCVILFFAPATLVSKGYGIAGDRQKESAADIAAISANTAQKAKRTSA